MGRDNAELVREVDVLFIMSATVVEEGLEVSLCKESCGIFLSRSLRSSNLCRNISIRFSCDTGCNANRFTIKP